jgi:uncharacterized protein
MLKKEAVELELDEVEALRLVDLEGTKMDEAAKSMKVSKPTICRIVNGARKKLADAVSNGKYININHNTMPKMDGTGPKGEGPMTGRGMGDCKNAPKGAGRGNGQGAGQGAGRGQGRPRGRGRA